MEHKEYDSRVLITNFIVILLSVLGMYLGDKNAYSLNKIFYLFSFFFFGISPAIEFLLQVKYWNGKDIDSFEYIFMNILIICILLLYIFFYRVFNKFKVFKFEQRLIIYFSRNIKNKNSLKIIMICILSLGILLYINKFSIYSLLLRGGDSVERIKTERMVGLLIANFIKPIPVATILIFKIKKIKKIKLEILLLVFVLLTNFPSSAPRFYIAAIYIPLLLIYIPFFRRRLMLNQALILGLIFLFPLMDELRRFSGIENLKFGFKFNMFLEGHFDSYQNFLRVVSNEIITNGKQILTTVFFFIPRKIWVTKSIGSGAYLKEKIGLSYDNIAMNYFGEGYINFGYLGILIFVIILAFINSRFDKIFWQKLDSKNILKVIYLLLLGLEFFILRGDLLSSVAFTTGIIFTVWFVYYILKK